MTAEKLPGTAKHMHVSSPPDVSLIVKSLTLKTMQHDCTSAESITRITVSIRSYMIVWVVHLGITQSNSTQMTWNTMQTDDNPKYFNSFKSTYVHFQSFPAHGTIFIPRLLVHSLYKRYKMKAQPRGRIAPSIRVSSPLLAWVFSKYFYFKLV